MTYHPQPNYGAMSQADLVRASLACCPTKKVGLYVGPWGRR